jgi:hypothetical protein
MKRILSLTLAAALIGATTASAAAQPYRNDGRGYRGSQYGYRYDYRRNNNGAALVFGALALGTFAALAASNNRGYYDDRYYGRPYGYSYGYSYGYPRRAYVPRYAYPPRGYYDYGYRYRGW